MAGAVTEGNRVWRRERAEGKKRRGSMFASMRAMQELCSHRCVPQRKEESEFASMRATPEGRHTREKDMMGRRGASSHRCVPRGNRVRIDACHGRGTFSERRSYEPGSTATSAAISPRARRGRKAAAVRVGTQARRCGRSRVPVDAAGAAGPDAFGVPRRTRGGVPAPDTPKV